MKMAMWMRIALVATFATNMLGTVLFLPWFQHFRESNGLPGNVHPLYLWIIASWIFMFGLCYLWLGITGRTERLFLVIGGGGKLSFVIILFVNFLLGAIPLAATLGSLTDLAFAVIFAAWLWTTRSRN
ncbi:MAG: hypothetical protein ABI878_02550 [Acidobacteriota bacterium]